MLEKTLINGITKMIEPKNGKPDYSLIGFSDAAKVRGSLVAYNLCLEKFYSSLLLDRTSEEDEIKKHNQQVEDEISRLVEKINIKNKELKELESNIIPEAQKEFQKANDDYQDFKQNPSKFVNIQKDKFMLWLYGGLSILISIFLFFYYSSVIFSAFFREIKLDKMTWYNSIFYPRAIEEAFGLGFTSGMIVILGPIIFLALGILLDTLKHRLKSKIKWAYIGGLVFTFLLDALFAYHISERIYESKAINVYGNVEPFNLGLALQNLDFWIIIGLGFCVYILFGKIFSLFNEQRTFKNEFDKVENALKSKIMVAETKLNELRNKVEDIKSEIQAYESEITDLRKKPEVISYNLHELKNILSEYTIGWISFLTNSGYTEDDVKQIENELKAFYETKGVLSNERA